jgi:Lon protease-like protein
MSSEPRAVGHRRNAIVCGYLWPTRREPNRVAAMSETLPLFPLGTVLYPGLLLPLHVFEERYRQLVRDLLAGPEPRRFGVIAIREGRETGVGGVRALHDIGCTATLRQVSELEDGRYDLVTVGTQRFLLTATDDARPYLRGEVDMLDEATGDEEGGRSRPGPSKRRSAATWARSPSAGSPRSASPTCPATPSGCRISSPRR